MRFLIRQGQLGTTKKLLSLRSIGAKGRLSLIHMDRIINIAMGLWHVGLLIPTGAYCADFNLGDKALIVANHFLETDLEKLKAAVSTGYARGDLFEATKTMPRDRENC